MGDEGSILDQAIRQIQDEALRTRIAREVELRGSRRFGLVFDRHLPEAVRLPDHPVRKGVTVTLRDESTSQSWRVLRFAGAGRSLAVLDGDGGEVPTDQLVVLREFGEPVYPGLRSVERIARGPADAPWHIVINGENFHVLQALRATRRGKVDLIYIDPPYNTGNDGWIYNDRYVDSNDRAKSSKWLSFMERRLLLARDLLKPTGVIIVAIGDDEHHRLRMLLDQVFGSQNFLANIGDKTLLMHPDFLFFHQDGDELVMDIIDPHRHDLADSAPKWAALAEYATNHSDRVRRVLAVIRDASGSLRALDLTADGISKQVMQATNKELLEALFASEGMNY